MIELIECQESKTKTKTKIEIKTQPFELEICNAMRCNGRRLQIQTRIRRRFGSGVLNVVLCMNGWRSKVPVLFLVLVSSHVYLSVVYAHAHAHAQALFHSFTSSFKLLPPLTTLTETYSPCPTTRPCHRPHHHHHSDPPPHHACTSSAPSPPPA